MLYEYVSDPSTNFDSTISGGVDKFANITRMLPLSADQFICSTRGFFFSSSKRCENAGQISRCLGSNDCVNVIMVPLSYVSGEHCMAAPPLPSLPTICATSHSRQLCSLSVSFAVSQFVSYLSLSHMFILGIRGHKQSIIYWSSLKL